MTDSELHPYVEWIASEARRPVATAQSARDRIMASVHAEPGPRRVLPVWGRLMAPRALRLSPAAGSLIAAGLVGIGVLAGRGASHAAPSPEAPSTVAEARPTQMAPDSVVKFVFVAPQAAQVSVVGDFNGWDSMKTPMARSSGGGVWTVTLPLASGRHLYAFVVDGSWSADPSAPLAPDDGFGHANSVKLVRRGSSL